MVRLVKPLFSLGVLLFDSRSVSYFGWCFLIWKSTDEIHNDVMNSVKDQDSIENTQVATVGFKMVVMQIALLDIIFSLDSVLTAVGLTAHFWIMAAAITCAIVIMLFASEQ